MELTHYLNDIINIFIDASITRVSDSGNMGYNYWLAADDIRSATNRVRLREDNIVSHFSKAKISCQYDAESEQYLIYIDLNNVRMNPRQSMHLTEAIARFRAEHL